MYSKLFIVYVSTIYILLIIQIILIYYGVIKYLTNYYFDSGAMHALVLSVCNRGITTSALDDTIINDLDTNTSLEPKTDSDEYVSTWHRPDVPSYFTNAIKIITGWMRTIGTANIVTGAMDEVLNRLSRTRRSPVLNRKRTRVHHQKSHQNNRLRRHLSQSALHLSDDVDNEDHDN